MGHREERTTAHARRGPRQLLDQLGPVAAGLLVLGVGSFAFLSLAGRALGPVNFAPVGTLWVLFNAAALALYQPIEQELSRATAERGAGGTGSRPVLVRCLVVGAVATVLLAVLVLLFLQPVSEQVFNGRTALALLFLVGLAGLFAEHVLRGLFSGNARFRRYGWQLATDGVLRVALPGALVVGAEGTPTSLAAALVAAPLLAACLTAGRVAPLARPGPPIGWHDVLPALGALTAAAVLSQLIVNAAPLAAQLLATPAEADRVGVFIAALVMTRIPLFFFGAVQATFLPSLARLSAQGDRPGFLHQVRMVLAGVGAAGAFFVLGLAAVGPWALRLLYGPAFDSGRTVLVVLGLGAAAYMVAQGLAQALIALRTYRFPLYAWAAGSAVFFGTLPLPLSLEARVSGALLAGGATAAAVMAALLFRALRGVRPTASLAREATSGRPGTTYAGPGETEPAAAQPYEPTPLRPGDLRPNRLEE